MSYSQSEPNDIDHAPDVRREHEMWRERRWEEFAAVVREELTRVSWQQLIDQLVDIAGSPSVVIGWEIDASIFAEEYGWPAVLQVIARVMSESPSQRIA